jgi:hypothetical protein
MKSAMLLPVIACVLIAWTAGPEKQDQGDGPSKKTEARRERRGSQAHLSEKELAFKTTLENSELRGFWQMTGAEGLAGKAPLSEPKPEHYTVDKVSKSSGDYWIISARIQYAEKDVTIPVTVRVVWAEDTAVITLDKMALPGLGTYSARVMVYRGFYSGTWFGANYGGVLAGQIVKQGATTQASQPGE